MVSIPTPRFELSVTALNLAVASAEATASTKNLVNRATAFRNFLEGKEQELEEEAGVEPTDGITVTRPPVVDTTHSKLSQFFDEKHDHFSAEEVSVNDAYELYRQWTMDRSEPHLSKATFRGRYEAWLEG